jgi:hypothetical protein
MFVRAGSSQPQDRLVSHRWSTQGPFSANSLDSNNSNLHIIAETIEWALRKTLNAYSFDEIRDSIY